MSGDGDDEGDEKVEKEKDITPPFNVFILNKKCLKLYGEDNYDRLIRALSKLFILGYVKEIYSHDDGTIGWVADNDTRYKITHPKNINEISEFIENTMTTMEN